MKINRQNHQVNVCKTGAFKWFYVAHRLAKQHGKHKTLNLAGSLINFKSHPKRLLWEEKHN
jgi:hypothetical protein